MPLEVGTNSYVSIAEATAYLSERLYADAWTAADAATHEKALIMAARVIDRQVLAGIKADSAQVMQFPRGSDTSVPQAVKHAQVEEALALLDRGNSKRRKMQQEGVTSFSIGSLMESFNGAYGRAVPLVSQEARELLRPYLAGTVDIA